MTENASAARVAAKQKRETWGGKGLNVAIIVAAVLTVAGIACWVMQLSGGMVQTGMRNLDSWASISRTSCSSSACRPAA